ncbi:MAG TPA: bifunctional hydroxymethylpyrimidine kinase/phosphomethylpyrimidine kinase [Bauldia sp.]|nr:bifunctional hydroxymethylpyrimidine kinase/phosphomethylpyrimidine kinase [Bauldia sp.]
MRIKPPVVVLNSLVSRGSVGGRASLFVLERLGFPVWFVPTVLLPWHPGHGPGTRVVPPEGLSADIARAVGDAPPGGILSGYFGHSPRIAGLIGLVERVKARRPAALYLCDPVIGDSGRFYVDDQTCISIRDDLVPRADIVTPNRFELAFLAGRDYRAITDNAALVAAARSLARPEVIVTSAFAAADEAANLLVTARGTELVVHRAVEKAPHGTGDLLAALYFGHRLGGAEPRDALMRATAATLRLVELADGGDELPLAQGQEAFFAAPAGVRVEAVQDG